MARRIRIVSDGRVTRVFDLASGQELEDVVDVEFRHEIGEPPAAFVTLGFTAPVLEFESADEPAAGWH